jgi:flotillin
MWDLAVPVVIAVIAILVVGLMIAKLYKRSTRDEAYVRTGLGGQKVVLDGGSIVLPIFHSTAAVNLKTLRLEVARGGPDSLITKDRMRVDIGAEFYLRVKPDASSIALAARRRSATAPTMPPSCASWSKPSSSTACARSPPP